MEGCADRTIGSLDGRPLCRKHFLSSSYKTLETISAQIREAQFQERNAEAAGRLLEQCMRFAADIACAPEVPSSIERAQTLDLLLWASELHGRLRRSARVPARIPVLLRSETADRPWEEKSDTELLSRHGAQLVCHHEVNIDDRLICVRLDNGWRAEARVVWFRLRQSGEIEIGLEFLTNENFWGLENGATTSPSPAG